MKFPIKSVVSNLHSSMVLLIFYLKLCLKSLKTKFTFQYGSTYISNTEIVKVYDSNLHSSMVLLICLKFRLETLEKMYLHSSMVLLILFMPKQCFATNSIYIPVWFYLYSTSLFSIHRVFSNLHSSMVLLILRN